MSKRILRKATFAGAIAAGALLAAGSTAAQADDMHTHDNIGIGNGNQATAPVQTPVDVCGNAAAAGGQAGAYCDGGSSASLDSGVLGDMHSHDNIGIGNGNQVQAPIQAPVNVCGNAASLVGQAWAACDGGASADISGDGDHGHDHGHDEPHADTTADDDVLESAPVAEGGDGADMHTHDNIGIGNGNQGNSGLQAPVDVSGNAVTGGGQAGAMSDGGSSASWESDAMGDMHSHDNIGIGNGNQVQAPIQTPTSVCGNAGSLVGQAGAACDGGADADISGGYSDDMPHADVTGDDAGALDGVMTDGALLD